MNVSDSTSSFVSSSYPVVISEKGNTFGFPSESMDELMASVRNSRTPPEMLLYNGSTTRAVMTSEQVAQLAGKYDPTNMTQEQYRDFLDELQGMGVISEMEKSLMDYDKGVQRLGYVDAEGDYVETNCQAYIGLGRDGNLLETLNRLNERGITRGVCACGSETHHTEQNIREWEKSYGQAKSRLSLMTGIVNSMMEYRRKAGLPSGKQTGSEAESSLMEQAAAPGGEFWLNLRSLIIESAKEKQKQAGEDAALELLDTILKSETGPEESRMSAAARLRLAMLANEVKEA